MSAVESLGAILLALGAICMFGARLIEALYRIFKDKQIQSKEDEANEAAKNSDDSYAEYRRLKREYDERNKE